MDHFSEFLLKVCFSGSAVLFVPNLTLSRVNFDSFFVDADLRVVPDLLRPEEKIFLLPVQMVLEDVGQIFIRIEPVRRGHLNDGRQRGDSLCTFHGFAEEEASSVCRKRPTTSLRRLC